LNRWQERVIVVKSVRVATHDGCDDEMERGRREWNGGLDECSTLMHRNGVKPVGGGSTAATPLTMCQDSSVDAVSRVRMEELWWMADASRTSD